MAAPGSFPPAIQREKAAHSQMGIRGLQSCMANAGDLAGKTVGGGGGRGELWSVRCLLNCLTEVGVCEDEEDEEA